MPDAQRYSQYILSYLDPLLEEEEEGTTQDKGPSMLTEP